MSHSKGLFAGSCPGKWQKYGRAHDGIQQQRCSRCGKVRNRKVRACFLLHDWKNSGRPKFGRQNQKCTRCAQKRVRQVRKCLWLHSWTAKGQDEGQVRCRKCGTTRHLEPDWYCPQCGGRNTPDTLVCVLCRYEREEEKAS